MESFAMKRILAAVLVVVFGLAFVGCAKPPAEEKEKPAGEAKEGEEKKEGAEEKADEKTEGDEKKTE